MKFVEAEWVEVEFGDRVIKATGDDGSIWYVQSVDSDVPPWPEFLEEYGAAAIKEPTG